MAIGILLASSICHLLKRSSASSEAVVSASGDVYTCSSYFSFIGNTNFGNWQGYFGPAVNQENLQEWYTLVADESPIPILM